MCLFAIAVASFQLLYWILVFGVRLLCCHSLLDLINFILSLIACVPYFKYYAALCTCLFVVTEG